MNIVEGILFRMRAEIFSHICPSNLIDLIQYLKLLANG